jgi:hypothetical protein
MTMAILYHRGALPKKFFAKARPRLIGIMMVLCSVVGICVYAVEPDSTRTSGYSPLSN